MSEIEKLSIAFDITEVERATEAVKALAAAARDAHGAINELQGKDFVITAGLMDQINALSGRIDTSSDPRT